MSGADAQARSRCAIGARHAEVVNVHTLGYRAISFFVLHAMGIYSLAVYLDHSVAVGSTKKLPNPTRCLVAAIFYKITWPKVS